MIGIDSLFTRYECMASETRKIDTRINISLRIQYEVQVLLEDLGNSYSQSVNLSVCLNWLAAPERLSPLQQLLLFCASSEKQSLSTKRYQ